MNDTSMKVWQLPSLCCQSPISMKKSELNLFPDLSGNNVPPSNQNKYNLNFYCTSSSVELSFITFEVSI